MKRMRGWMIGILIWSAAAGLQAASVAQGKQLMELGFYSAAEEVLRQVPQAPGAQAGLLQALLAQGRAAAARTALANASGLTSAQEKLYTALIMWTEGQEAALALVNPQGLDDNERKWLSYVQGLQALAQGKWEEASSAWKGLPADFGGLALAQAARGQMTTEELAKRLKKLRRQEEPLARYAILGLIGRGKYEEARSLLDSNNVRLPKPTEGLLRALTYPPRTPQRAQALMTLLPSLGGTPQLLQVAVGLCVNEPDVNLLDVEDQLGNAKTDPAVAVILAQAWLQKAAPQRAYDLLVGSNPAVLPLGWQRASLSTLASAAVALPVPRYRQAADALVKLRDLPQTSPGEVADLQEQIAQLYARNEDYADAAQAYMAVGDLQRAGLPAVLCWLSAKRPEEAKAVLKNDFAGKWEGVRAYLMDVRKRGGDFEQAYASLVGKTQDTMQERWPVEYLRVAQAAEKSPQEALRLLEKLLPSLPAQADYRTHFLLQKYRLLVALRQTEAAAALLDEAIAQPVVDRQWAMLALSRALAQRRPQEALRLLPKAGDLQPAERVTIRLLLAQQLGSAPKDLEEIQDAIDALPTVERPTHLLALAKVWAQAGDLAQAVNLVEALQESAIEGALRDEADFLRASLDELAGSPATEAQWIALSQRGSPEMKTRGLIRLAAYYAQNGQGAAAQKIFYEQLVGLTRKSSLHAALLPQQEVLLRSLTAIAAVLPPADAATLNDWIEAQR